MSLLPSDFSSVANGRQVQRESGQGDYFPSYLPARPQVGNGLLPAEASSPLEPERPHWDLGTIPLFSSLDLGVVAASYLPTPGSFTTLAPHLSIVLSFHSLQSPF